MSFDNLMGYILSISMSMQNFITIFHSVQLIAPLSLFFRIWSSAKPRPTKNVISQSLGLDLVNINVYAKVYQNIPLSSRDRAVFTFFRIWRSAKPRPMINVILQFLKLDLVNINLSAKFCKRFKSLSSLFSEFEPWQNLDQSQMSFDYLMGYIMSISMCMQNFITIFHSVQEIGPFSRFQNLALGKASTDEKCYFAISCARSWQYQSLRKSLSKYSTQFKR